MRVVFSTEAERPDPIITKELAEWLAERIPARTVGPHETMEQAQRYAGRHDLAVELIQMFQEQLDTLVITDEGAVVEQEPLHEALFLDLPGTAHVSR